MAGHLLSEFDNNAVVNNAVNGGRGGQGILEDLIPLREDKIGSDDHATALVALSKQGEKDFHLVTGLLNIADVIEDQNFEAIQAAKLKFQFEVTPCAQQAVHQAIGWGEENTVADIDQFVSDGGGEVRFAFTWQPEDQ